jgi:hypothetical protein
MKNWHACWLLVALAFSIGCGKEERREATTFYQVLNQKKADLAAINALEKDLLGSTAAWCQGIISNGAGKGKDLAENAASAKQLAQSASAVAGQLGHVRQSIYDQPLKQEYPQEVRSALINQISERQRMLQHVTAALQASADGFLQSANSRGYAGDTYPAAIDQLNTLVANYRGPEDAVGKAIEELRVKYDLPAAGSPGKT